MTRDLVTWLPIPADDVEAALRRVEEAGGTIVTGRTEIPEIAMAHAVFADTEGNLIDVVGDMTSGRN